MNPALDSLIRERNKIAEDLNTLLSRQTTINAKIEEEKCVALSGAGKCYRIIDSFYYRIDEESHWYVSCTGIQKTVTQEEFHYRDEITRSEFMFAIKSRMTQILEEVTEENLK